jgi:hypothetical protein
LKFLRKNGKLSPVRSAALVAALLAAISGATVSRNSLGGGSEHVRTVEAGLGSPGRYRVWIAVGTPAHDDSVSVTVEGGPSKTVTVTRTAPTLTSAQVTTHGTRLTVRAAGHTTTPTLRLIVQRLTTSASVPAINVMTLASGALGTLSSLATSGVPAPATQAPSSRPLSGKEILYENLPQLRPPAAGGISHYRRLVWTQNFSGRHGASVNRGIWKFDDGDWGPLELDTDTSSPANLQLDGRGHLQIAALHRTTTGPDGVTRPYSSARIETGRLFSFTYGRVEARMKIPAGRGLWPAFWMLGDSIDRVGWPASGEIDVMESHDANPNLITGTIHGPVVHSPLRSFQVQGKSVSASSLAKAFHTYGVVWQPGRITWTVDGRPYATVTRRSVPRGSWVFNAPFHLVLNLAVGPTGEAPTSATRFPARLLVDWVRLYQ